MKITRPVRFSNPSSASPRWKTDLNPNATISRRSRSREIRCHGYVMVGAQSYQGHGAAGRLQFPPRHHRSSNTYFITVGLRTGIEKIVRLGEKFHLGERTGLPTRQETPGYFPTLERMQSSDWRDGDSANICFGQGEMAVTPMQMAVAYSAIANGGKVLWPRLVERIEPQDPASGEAPTIFPSGVVRDHSGRASAQFENPARRDAGGNRRPGRHGPRRSRCPGCAFAARPARRR